MTFAPHVIDPELDLELVRDIPVTPEAVFSAWTDPESLTQWFTPHPYTTPVCEIDLRPGGAFRTVMNDPDGQQIADSTGCYLHIVPNELLVWTSALTTDFRPQADAMPFTGILEFRPNGSGGCIYRAIAVHQDSAGRAQHEEMGFHQGWGIVVDQLVAHLQAI
ncbi:SRPBCC family protein [Candidatus Poriferisocius sp.]|uniref:SRPBCC family protein n=1 Tax=Candidatus Poriferisocius sp. TaxID=3101276 RepID=UPI003B5AE139